MTRNTDRDTEVLAQRKVASHYKILGYDVLEKPGPDRLPDFMRGMAPNIVARSESDNVVVEVKRRGSLKGSNDLVDIAARVSEHPDWRLELVVLNTASRQVGLGPDFKRLREWVRRAAKVQLFDMAFISLADILMRIVRGVAEAHRIRPGARSDEELLVKLEFQGVLPGDIIQECLAVVSARNELLHGHDGMDGASEEALGRLLRLCERLDGLV